jgi:hypothetical protein
LLSAADRNGALLDAVHSDRGEAFCGALRLLPHGMPQLGAKGLDTALLMAPFDFAPQCEVGRGAPATVAARRAPPAPAVPFR